MRNKPVNAITIFLPTAEVKNWDHFISYQEGLKKFDAKVSPDRGKTKFTKKKVHGSWFMDHGRTVYSGEKSGERRGSI